MARNMLILAGLILVSVPGLAEAAQLRAVSPTVNLGVDIASLRSEVTALEKRAADDEALIKLQEVQLNFLINRVNNFQDIAFKSVEDNVLGLTKVLSAQSTKLDGLQNQSNAQSAKLDGLQYLFDHHTHTYGLTTFGTQNGQLTQLKIAVPTETSTGH